MAGFKVGFIMFRIIHRSSAFPGSMKKSHWVVRPKKANMEIEEDGKSIIDWNGKRGGVARQRRVYRVRQGEGMAEEKENEDFRKT